MGGIASGRLSADEDEFLRCSSEAKKQREAAELEATRRLAEEQKQRAELSEQREKGKRKLPRSCAPSVAQPRSMRGLRRANDALRFRGSWPSKLLHS
jgi:hypothetical protein